MRGGHDTPLSRSVPPEKAGIPASATHPAAKSRRSSLMVAAVGLAMVTVTAGTAFVLTGRHHRTLGMGQPPKAEPTATAPIRVKLPAKPSSYLGVYESGAPDSYTPVETFARTVGRQPNLVLYFSSWGDPFQARFAGDAHARGAVPFVQLEPWTTSMAAIAAGRSDTYLRSYARAVAAYRYPVLLGFGHEMNGNWYPWGWTHVTPDVWVAAWRHVVSVFRSEGARNATWIWTANLEGPGDGPLRAYWPGARYVNWVGITGYLFFPQDTFARSYRPTIAAVRRFSHRPILISETAVGPLAGQAAKIPGLFSLIHSRHLLGFVWFDEAQHGGVYHQDWRLEGHPAAVRVFRRALRSHLRS